MQRVAIFVDAGYLFAAGATALTGTNQPRSHIKLDQTTVIALLNSTADAKASSASLLRIYWYDGLLPEGVSSEQQRLAGTDDVKLRLGVVSASGQQKGVDSLLVTDLVELARNHAISDAVVLSGDEDVRVGVQIAQSFGVRVHLIGIEPRKNQSRALAQESDTTTEWDRTDINNFMSVEFDYAAPARSMYETVPVEIRNDVKARLDEVVVQFLQSLDPNAVNLLSNLGENETIPGQYDRRLLGISRNAIGRELGFEERDYLRTRFKAAARDAADARSE